MSITPEQLEKTDAEREREKKPTAPLEDGDLVVEDLVVEDLLVEDVSIDGMCGVY